MYFFFVCLLSLSVLFCNLTILCHASIASFSLLLKSIPQYEHTTIYPFTCYWASGLISVLGYMNQSCYKSFHGHMLLFFFPGKYLGME